MRTTRTFLQKKSRLEIERTLMRYGASAFAFYYDGSRAMINFAIQNRHIRMAISLPDRSSREFTHYCRGKVMQNFIQRSPDGAHREWEQACRQRWRSMALVIKAKLEAVECGITTIEQEFMAHIVLPNGSTVGDWMRPQLEQAYSQGDMPKPIAGFLAE